MIVFGPAAGGQSLADAAKRESERRKALEAAGVESKSFVNGSMPRMSNGNVTTGAIVQNPGGRSQVQPGSKGRVSAATFRAALRKIDNDIRKCEEQLAFSRRRYELERNVLRRPVRLTHTQSENLSRERLLLKVQELEAKLKRLLQEKRETYDSGRRAGFQPGELDGHSFVP
jgi:hypothetical protein